MEIKTFTMDAVNHPPHYNQYKREVIELTEKLDFCLGNACKYILRAPYKGATEQDYEKASWYLNRLVKNKDRAYISDEILSIAKDFDNALIIAILESVREEDWVRVSKLATVLVVKDAVKC